jgi:polysaccharide biosynthesis protein PslH
MACQPHRAHPLEGAGVTGDILFLAHRVPFPPDRGDKIRSWNILKALAKIAPVHVAALVDPADQVVEGSPLHNIAASLTLVPRTRSKAAAMATAMISGRPASVEAFASSAFQSAVTDLLKKHNILAIYAFSSQMAQFVPMSADRPRFVMDFVDMDSAKFDTYADQSTGLARFANHQEGKRLFNYECAVAKRANISLFVSEVEASLFRQKSSLADVIALENGVDLDRYQPKHASRVKVPGEGPLLVFTGQIDYAPNIDAVVWFAQNVLPKLPNSRFAIVGRAPTAKVLALKTDPRVIVTGEVEDPRDWIAAADIIVAPLLLARGVQNKVLEAMAMGKAVVASQAAAEGIDATEMVVATGSDGFAQAINDLLTDPARLAAMGSAARARMEARYSWDACTSGLPKLVMP